RPDRQVVFLSAGGNTQTITVNVVGDLAPELSETFFINLSVASGNALLADEQARGAALDTDTKFYVVNDGSPDRTYEYGQSGQADDNYALAGGDTAPQDIADPPAADAVLRDRVFAGGPLFGDADAFW